MIDVTSLKDKTIAAHWPGSPVLPMMTVTFTGIDERTDLKKCEELCADYPIEFGILFGANRQKNRYPNRDFVKEAVCADIMYAYHLCNEYSNWAINGYYVLDLPVNPAIQRIQVNSSIYNDEGLKTFQKKVNCPVLVQWRKPVFPEEAIGKNIHYVYDCSGGRGIYNPDEKWPQQNFNNNGSLGRVGYAGGINPDNVLDVLSKIDAYEFWIDMETGVRDDDDWFSIEKCRKVCEAIWG